MPVFGSNLLDSDNASLAYGIHMRRIVKDVRVGIDRLPATKSLDAALLGSLHALAVLANAGSRRHGSIAKTEVDEWRTSCLSWFDKVSKKLPKKVDPLELRTSLENVFDRLHEIGVGKPKMMWERELARDLAEAAEKL